MGQIAAWDFFGENTGVATSTADLFNINLISAAGANNITRGATAAFSTANNSFRTAGFKNDGIAVTNTDYFQITLGVVAGYKLSLSTIDARFGGTATYYATPGVTSQFAYSLDGTTFTLIGTPAQSTSLTLTQINLSGIAALQNVPSGTTIRIRYYASGMTATGGWGFTNATGQYGLAIGGSCIPPPPTIGGTATTSAFTTTYGTPSAAQSFPVTASNLTSNLVATAPTGFEVSADGITFGNTAIIIASGGTTGTIYIRLTSLAPVLGNYNSNSIAISSAGTSVYITTPSTGNFVNPKPITITANNITKAEGLTLTGAAGNTAFSTTGLVNGESIGSVTMSYGSSALSTAAAGTYAGDATPSAATGGTFNPSNYSITYATGSVTVTPSTTPACPEITSVLPSVNPTICQGIAAPSLTATVTNNSGSAGTPTIQYQWYYNTANSNTILGATLINSATLSTYTPLSTASEIGTRYYFCVGYATDNSCGQFSTTQTLASNAVMVTVNPTPDAPTTVNASVTFCSGTNPTVAILTASGTTAISWFNVATGGTALLPGTALATGNYYASQTSSAGCESPRLTVAVTVNTTPTAPTGTSPQYFCNGTSQAISNLTITGNSILWYSVATAGTSIPPSTALVSGTHYYASQTSAAGCESPRLDITASFYSTVNYGTSTTIATVNSTNNHLVISQVYGGGGNTGAPYINDFVEIFNPTLYSVNLSGWSIQYQSSTGTTWPIAQMVALSGTIAPGKYYLVQLASQAAVGASLPTPDATGSLNLSGTGGKIALVNSTTLLTTCTDISIIDKVGYGSNTVACNETANTTAPSNTTSVNRTIPCIDLDNNNTDFAVISPNPHNSASAANICSGGNTQTICSGAIPIAMFAGGASGSGSFTYQWYYKLGNNVNPTGSTTGWTSLGSTDYAQTSVYTPTTGITNQTTYAVFVTPSGTPTCNPGASSWASGGIVVNINPAPPLPTFTATTSTNNNPAPCTGTTGLTYTINAVVGATGYLWTVPFDWVITSGQNTVSITVTPGAVTGNITVTPTNSCGGTNTVSLAVATNVVTPPPVATAGTSIGTTSFNANWNAVTNAIGYYLDVYYYASNSNIAKWTFPTSGTIVTPDTSNSNNTTKTITTTGGAIITSAGASTQAPSANSWVTGAYTKAWQVIIDATGYTSLKLSSKQISSATGPRDFKVQYKLSAAAAWVDVIGGTVIVATNFTTGVLANLSLPSACDGQSTVYVQWVMTTNTSVANATVAAGGTSRIDDVSFTGTLKTYVTGYQNYFTTNLTEEIAGLLANTTYYYIVRSEVNCGTTNNSNEISVTTGTPCTPTAAITSFSPSTGPAGTLVTITGTNFSAATAVKFGAAPATTYTIVSNTTIIAEVPSGAPTDKISITVASCPAFSLTNFIPITQSATCGVANTTASDLFISEVYDAEAGSLSYVEIFNGKLTPVDLAAGNYVLRIVSYGATGSSTNNYSLTGIIPSGGTYLAQIGSSSTSCSGIGTIGFTNTTSGGFNGNDQIYLFKNGTSIDYVPNPNYTGAPDPGFSQSRKPTAVGPTTTYNVNDWIISTTENCSNLGIAPYSLTGNSITITTQPQDVNCSSISFSVVATSSTGSATYLWKYFNTATGLWDSASHIIGVTVSNTNTATMTITGNAAQLINYQFYCVMDVVGCSSVTNAVQYTYNTKPYYRCKGNGNWSDPTIWEISTSPTIWTNEYACTYPTKENSSAVFIETPFAVTQDLSINIDYLEIKSGGTLKTSTVSKLTVSDSTVGPDFIVNGTWEYNSDSVNTFGFDVATGTWQLGANGTIIKTNRGSAGILRDKYETGMVNIPATANWIIRYLGADVNFTTTGGTYYPNLIFESNSGLWSPLASATSSRFTGNTGFATVKGNLDIGGTGIGKVTVFNENTNAQPMLINGNLQIRNGDTLTNIGTANGTGFEIKGNVIVDGTGVFTANGGSGVVKLTGAAAQTVSGTGVINLRKLLVTNSAPVGQNVTFSKDISVPDTLQITQGFVDAGTTTLNGTAKLIMSDGTLQLSKNATVLPELTGAYLLTGGTVIFNGDGTVANAQTIRPVKYYNITSLNTGDRIMSPTDTVSIANIFNRGTNSFTFTGSNVNYNGIADQTLASFTANNTINKTYNNLILSNSGIKSLGGPVDVEGALTLKDNITLALGSQDLTFKSTITRTANIAQIPSTTFLTYGTGRFVVERFIPSGSAAGLHPKSWQFVSTPTNGGQTINQSWQEGNSPLSNTINPGYGTIITSNNGGNLMGAQGLGFDSYTAPGPTMKYFNNGLWVGVASTSIPVFNAKGYMLFVRGDRSVTSYSALNNATPTTLRTRGTIFEPRNNPPPTITINATDTLVSIGNPYASKIDFSLIEKDNALGVHQAFWVWDPLKPSSLGLGGYQYFAASTTGGQDFLPMWGGTTNYPTGVPNYFIQSGQAFLVENTLGTAGFINFLETAKASGSNMAFRAPVIHNNQTGSLKTLLYIGSGETAVLTDATLVTFKNTANNNYDSEDAKKVFSPGENISILRDSKNLVMESRKTVVRTDTIYLSLINLRSQTYEFRFAPLNLPLTGMDIRLVDRFLRTSTPLSSGDSSIVNFTITTDPASSSATRFIIVFKKVNPATTHTATVLGETAKNTAQGSANSSVSNSSIEVYPNPITNHIAHISFINQPLGNYTARVLSINGQVVAEKKMTVKSNFEIKDFQLMGLSKSSYQLQITGEGGNPISKQIIIQ